MTPSETLSPDFGRAWVTTLLDTLLASADEIGDLDRLSGDGDFGENLTTALTTASTRIRQTPPARYGEWSTALSLGFLDTGGTSGPLFGMFFRSIAQAVADDTANGTGPAASAGSAESARSEPVPLAAFSDGLTSGVATIQRYGGAKVGDKTMVDALAPAAEALRTEVVAGSPAHAALRKAADAAVAGALATADILARRGRASYVGEVSRGVLDPGAVAAALMIQAAAAAAQQDRADGAEPAAGGGTGVDTTWFTDHA